MQCFDVWIWHSVSFHQISTQGVSMTYEALLVLFIVWCCRRDKQPSYSVLTTAFEAHWIISLVVKCITGSCDDLSGPCEILPSSNASGNLGVSGMNVKVIKPDYSGMWWASTFCSTFIHLTIRRLIVSGRGGGGGGGDWNGWDWVSKPS